MHISVLLLTMFLTAPPQVHARPTFQDVVGSDAVKSIVTEVLNSKAEAYKRQGPQQLEYDSGFVNVVSDRILQSDLPPDTDVSRAEEILRKGFGRFVDNLVRFAREKVQGPVLRFTKDIYDQYMHRPEELQKCGEIPCNQPPCCRYCAPPPCKPGEGSPNKSTDKSRTPS